MEDTATIKFEPYEQVYIGPILNTLLAFASSMCKGYWEKIPNVGFYETVRFVLCLFLIVIPLFYLPQLLRKAFNNKGLAIVLFLIVVGLGALTWNSTNSADREALKEADSLTDASNFHPHSEPSSCHEINVNDRDQIDTLRREVGEVGDWEAVCLGLHVKDGTRNNLEYTTLPTENKVRRCINAFLEQDVKPCWEKVVQMLCRDVHNNVKAKKLADKYGVSYSELCE